MPDYVPWYSLGPAIGLVVNFILCLLCLIFYSFHSRYRPLRSLLFFYLSLSAYFLGYAGYGYQSSPESIVFWYRVMLLGLAWMPATWLWFVTDIRGRTGAPFISTTLTVALAASAALIFINHPAVLALPLESSPARGIMRPQSWLIRPLIQVFDVGVIAVSMVLIPLRWWPGPGRPGFVQPLMLGLLLWLLGGVHDTAYAVSGFRVFGRTVLWAASTWLSLCLAASVAMYFRMLDSKLRESTRMLHLVLDTIPLSVYWKDRDLAYLGANRRFSDLAGLREPEAVKGLSDGELEWRAAREGVLEEDDRAIMEHGRGRPGQTFETRDSRGRPVWLKASRVVLRDDSGGRVGVLGALEDVTERVADRVRVEELRHQLFQAQKMEAVGTLAGGIAHDFNNLIQAISGYALLLGRDPETCPAKQEFVTGIGNASERAADLVKGLLTFGRKVEPELTGVDISREMDLAARMLRRVIPKMVDIDVKAESGLPLVAGDRNQLGQILMNLGTNARDAMPGGGMLVFAAEAVDLNHDQAGARPGLEPGRYVRLTVSDTGRGMSPEVVNKIFEPFFTTKGAGRGTGLGLAVIYGIVSSHNGRIDCDSTPGLGTTFTIHLPEWQGPPPVTKDRAETETRQSPGSETVLIVDDESPIRELAREVLTDEGYRVLAAADGETALEILGREGRSIDLVILDLGMPGMGGQACLREMLKLQPGARVIISSGYSDSGMMAGLQAEGAIGFLPKPFRITALAARIREFLDRQ